MERQGEAKRTAALEGAVDGSRASCSSPPGVARRLAAELVAAERRRRRRGRCCACACSSRLALFLAVDAERGDRARQQALEADRLAAVLALVDRVRLEPRRARSMILPSRNFSRSRSRSSVEKISSSIDSSIESRPMLRSRFMLKASPSCALRTQPLPLALERFAEPAFLFLVQHRLDLLLSSLRPVSV